jgi:hypothetical protein
MRKRQIPFDYAQGGQSASPGASEFLIPLVVRGQKALKGHLPKSIAEVLRLRAKKRLLCGRSRRAALRMTALWGQIPALSLAALVALAVTAKVVPGVNAALVAVVPVEGDGIAPYW